MRVAFCRATGRIWCVLKVATQAREVMHYSTTVKHKNRPFQTDEAAGPFDDRHDHRDYPTLLDVASRLTEKVIHEHEKLLMHYYVATMRLGME